MPMNNRFTHPTKFFIGWNTKANGTGKVYADGAVVENLAPSGYTTLYAQWSPKLELMFGNVFDFDGFFR